MKKIWLICFGIILLFLACGSDTESPRVRMWHPADGDVVWATVYVTAIAVDNDKIDRVEFFFTDTLIGEQEIIFQDSFYQHVWMTGNGPDSVNVAIYAVGYDANENSTVSDTVHVFVDNAGHPPGRD